MVYVDGIYVARNLVALIASRDERVLSWYMVHGETKRAWKVLLSRITQSDMVVTDGGSGFVVAAREEWQRNRTQGRLLHACFGMRK